MANPISSATLPLAIPYRFLDSETPWFLLPTENVPWSYNCELINQGVTQRKAYSIASFPTLGAYKQIAWAQPYVNGSSSPPVFFCATDSANQIVYLNSNYTPVFTTSWTALDLNTRANVIMFNNRLISVTRPFQASAIFDGTTWATLGYTFSTITDPYIPCAYKGRMYIADNAAPPRLEYYPVGAIAGASAGLVSFEGVLSTAIQGHASFQSNDITTNELYYCVWDTAGNVAFYAGDNPGASNWRQVGFANIGYAANRIKNSYIRVGGDIYIIARSGLYSARNLLLQGSLDAANLAAPIRKIWTSLFNSISRSPAGHFSVDENKIYINIPNNVEFGYTYADLTLNNYEDGGGFSSLIYDRTRQAWMYQEFGSYNDEILPMGQQPLPGYEILGQQYFGVDAGGLANYRSCLYTYQSQVTVDTTNAETDFYQTTRIRSRLYFSQNSTQTDGSLNTLKALKANIFLAAAGSDLGTFDAKAGCISFDGGDTSIIEVFSNAKLRKGNQVVTFHIGANGDTLVPYIELIGDSLIGRQSLISAQLVIEKGVSIG